MRIKHFLLIFLFIFISTSGIAQIQMSAIDTASFLADMLDNDLYISNRIEEPGHTPQEAPGVCVIEHSFKVISWDERIINIKETSTLGEYENGRYTERRATPYTHRVEFKKISPASCQYIFDKDRSKIRSTESSFWRQPFDSPNFPWLVIIPYADSSGNVHDIRFRSDKEIWARRIVNAFRHAAELAGGSTGTPFD